MHPELQRYLDGETPRDALPPGTGHEAEVWDQWIGAVRDLGADPASPWLESRIMNALPDAPQAPLWRRIWDSLVRPRAVQIRPVTALGALAVVVLALLLRPDARPLSSPDAAPLASAAAGPSAVPTAVAASTAAQTVYMQFVYDASNARSVSVAGDFNAWTPGEHPLSDPDGDGVWTGLVPLMPGLHEYMFVVNGDRWVVDPRAARQVEDGFGKQNALLAVPPARSST